MYCLKTHTIELCSPCEYVFGGSGLLQKKVWCTVICPLAGERGRCWCASVLLDHGIWAGAKTVYIHQSVVILDEKPRPILNSTEFEKKYFILEFTGGFCKAT